MTEDIENECYAGKESLESVLDKTEHDVFELLSTRQTGDYVPIRTVVMNALEKIEKAAQQEGTVTGIPTGFIDLDSGQRDFSRQISCSWQPVRQWERQPSCST